VPAGVEASEQTAHGEPKVVFNRITDQLRSQKLDGVGGDSDAMGREWVVFKLDAVGSLRPKAEGAWQTYVKEEDLQDDLQFV